MTSTSAEPNRSKRHRLSTECKSYRIAAGPWLLLSELARRSAQVGNRRALEALVAVETKPTTLSVSLYSFCASCYRRFPYRHSARQAAGPLIENLPYVLTGDREPVDLYLLAATGLRSSRSATTQRPTLPATAAPLTKALSLRKTRRGLFSRGPLQAQLQLWLAAA